MFFARYLNCIMLHLTNVCLNAQYSDSGREEGIGGIIEAFSCYVPLIVAGLGTVRKAEDLFVITDEVMRVLGRYGNVCVGIIERDSGTAPLNMGFIDKRGKKTELSGFI